jgi:myosin I
VSSAEASKVIMQYVAAVSGKGVDIDRVKEQLLKSNPVLEGFSSCLLYSSLFTSVA